MTEKKDSLVIVWTSGDKDVAMKMVFMYTLNSKLKNWWEDITLIIWGPSSKLLTLDHELQEYVQEMKEAAIKVEACITCANMYGVAKNLVEMGIDVKPMGPVLTQYIKEGRKVMTF